MPGLDGLRTLILAAVLVFNQGFVFGQGGFLGISSAFTLSGFLLATLALAEWSQVGSLKLVRFWERRGRKIVPPVLVTVAGVVALQTTLRVGSVPTFRSDVLSSVTFMHNWRLAYPADGFARSFSDLSALSHLWPISITGQVYLLFPLAFMAAMMITRRNWRLAGLLFAAGAAVSFGAAWTMSNEPGARELVYYGTHTRVGELLVGVVFGYAVLTPGFRKLLGRELVQKVVRVGAVVAIAALAALWTFIPYESERLFHGITLVNALLTAWVILAVTMPGPASTLLGFWLLRRLGQLSFLAYLAHWPIYLLLDEDRLGFEGVAQFGIRVAATMGAAFAAYWVIQAPFRSQVRLPRFQLGLGLTSCAAVIAAVVFVLPVNPPAGITLDIDSGQGPGQRDVVVPPDGGEAAHVLLIGDEGAGSLVSGVETWNTEQDTPIRLDTHITPHCPLGGPGDYRLVDEDDDTSTDCNAWRPRLPKMFDGTKYDAIVVLMGASDVGERKIDRDWRHLGDPEYDRWMADELNGLADVLAKADAPVLWATNPHVRINGDGASGEWPSFEDNDPQRIDRLNELIVATVGARDGFQVADLDAWLHGQPEGEFNPDLRDGTAFTTEGANSVSAWLLRRTLDVAG